jgi:2-iminobutanoate/2-iminopropanoate deaminase
MPAPLGPYSPIVAAGPWLVCSGQLGVSPDASGAPKLVDGGAAAQLAQALDNAAELLDGEGASRHDVVKTTVFVTDLSEATALNEAYARFFGDHRPARSMVGVAALPLGAMVEVELWAFRLARPSAGGSGWVSVAGRPSG